MSADGVPKLRVALACEDGAGVRAMRMLADRGHRIVAVFSDSKAGAGASAAGVGRCLGARVMPAADVRRPESASLLRALGVDLLLSVHARKLIDAALLDAAGLGSYNLHPGPLPECAGLHPNSWAIWAGTTYHGVTLHRMTAEYDAGDIVFQDRWDLEPSDTGLTVLSQCVRRGMKLLEQFVDLTERGEPVPAVPQNLSKRRWFGTGPPQDGRLDWRLPAGRVADFVRACDYRPFASPWGWPRCTAHGVDVEIVAATVADVAALGDPGTVTVTPTGDVLVATGAGAVQVRQVAVDGRPCAPADVLWDGELLPSPEQPAVVAAPA